MYPFIANVNQFLNLIAVGGRRWCVFLKPVEQVESISGSSQWFRGWLCSCFLVDLERNAEECTTGLVLLNSYERFPFPWVVVPLIFGRERMSFPPWGQTALLSSEGFQEDLQIWQGNKPQTQSYPFVGWAIQPVPWCVKQVVSTLCHQGG